MKSNYILLLILIFTISCKNQKATNNNNSETTVNDSITDSKPVEIENTAKVRDTSKYYIYFTLDDGPQLPATQICEKILQETQTKATFFMVGLHDSDAIRNKAVNSINDNPLFILANHSNTHAFRNRYKKFYMMPDSAVSDFMIAEKKLNIKHKIIRLPGMNTWAINGNILTLGSSISKNVAKKLDSLGYFVYGWDTEWKFVKGSIPLESADQMIKKVETKLASGNTYHPKSIVILVHDRMFGKPQYADSLRKFITTFKNNDKYVFDTLDNYPVEELTNNQIPVVKK